ncbi:Dnmt3b [Symbiodinium sp. CCMP2592]|nr:Dnmt3b [Symbiodinium sp. CCMP2592]
MAHCSEAERLFAVLRVERVSEISGWDYHCAYDILLEFLRHDIMDLVSLMLPREGAMLFAVRDILTSLKCDAGECILSGQFLAPHRGAQDLLVSGGPAVRRIRENSRVLASFTLGSGAGRHGLMWLQQQYRLADQDRGSGAAVKHQERTLLVPVEPNLKALIRDCKRSILRGLGPDQLKDSFEVPKLRALIPATDWGIAPWDPSDVHSWLDAVIISLWFMFREVELASLRRGHFYLEDGQVVVLIASEKKDTQGSLTTRSLTCSCRFKRQVFCPFHAARRHLQRLHQFEIARGAKADFAFPDPSGQELSKAAVVRGFRSVLHAAGIALTRPDEAGVHVQRFHGHMCRVSGAQWLISLNLAVHLVQILGRWSSAAIWKYVQSTPLLQLPAATAQALCSGDTAASFEESAEVTEAVACPSAAPAASSSQSPTMQDLLAIREEMEALRSAAKPRGETFVQSVRSRVIHRIKVDEESNPPKKWRTVCGWPYGVRNFTRLPAAEASDDKCCQRCWEPRDDESSSSSSYPSSGSSNNSADAESSSDIGEYACGNVSRQKEWIDSGSVFTLPLDSIHSDSDSQLADARGSRAVDEHNLFPWQFGSGVREQCDCGLVSFYISSASMSEPSIDELALQAGAGGEIKRYLSERGIRSSGALALIAKDQDQFDNLIVGPLLDGWRPDPMQPGIDLSDVEKPIAKAILRFMWCLAVEHRQKAAAAATAPIASPPASSAALGTSTPADASAAKVPKTLPAGEWRTLIERYNGVLLNGQKRIFPERELLGAESVVARVLHEHRVTKQYSPIQLGEILQRRSFQSNGEVNPLAKRSRSTRLSVEDGVLLEEPHAEEDWVPRGSLSTMDGLNSIRWCYVLCELGPELEIHEYFDSMVRKSRLRNNQVQRFKAYFEQASWRLCARLRANHTWKEAAQEIMSDVAAFQEAMLKEEPAVPSPNKRKFEETQLGEHSWIPQPRKGKGKEKGKTTGGRKGTGKGKNQWKSSSSSWERPWHSWSRDWFYLSQLTGTVDRVSVDGDTQAEPTDSSSGLGGDAGSGPRAPPVNESPSGSPAKPLESRSPSVADSASVSKPPLHVTLPPLSGIDDVIILSMFDGMGSAVFAVQQLGVRIRALFVWEIDAAAVRVSNTLFKGLRFQRGDLEADDATTVAHMLQQMDPGARSPILVLAGPPCPDYSRLKEGDGRQGKTGRLFQPFCDFLDALEHHLSDRVLHIIAENVLMNRKEDVDYFSRRMRCSPTLICASDFGLISRPRLWWTRLDFGVSKTNPVTGKPMRWSKAHGQHRLHIDPPRDDPKAIKMPGLEFHQSILDGSRRLPCLTTPAASDAGREPPRSLHGEVDAGTRRRWLEGGRQYAPWNYGESSMVSSADGERQLLPAEVKEQAHHFFSGVTRVQNVSPKDRHRLLGNSWHVGVAKFVIWLVLSQIVQSRADAVPGQPTTHDPFLSEVLQQCRARELPLSRGPDWPVFACMPPTDSEWEHWFLSYTAEHPLLCEPRVSRALELVYAQIASLGEGIDSYRRSVLASLQALVLARKESSDAWFASLKPHVRAAYRLDSPVGYLQIPVFIELIRGCGYPEWEALASELTQGLPMLGRLRPSPGWMPRLDEKYQEPISLAAFSVLNKHHVEQRLQNPRVDAEWECLLKEVMQEVSEGRMEGPFRAPASWRRQTVAVADAPGFDQLLECPDEHPFAAWAFSVVQQGSDGGRKVRRCEDYRRSCHNDTISASDVPPHDDVSVYVAMVRYLQTNSLATSGHAFRGYRKRFSFNRITDALIWLARNLLAIPIIHYVDDLGSVDPASSSASSYKVFESFCQLMGFRLKESKAQAPDVRQKLQGVVVQVQDSGVLVEPSPSRVAKLLAEVRLILQSDCLSPENAAKLAGKIGFLSTSLWGNIGQALSRPLHGRARGSRDAAQTLNGGLRSSLECLLELLSHPMPRFIPYSRNDIDVSVLYADAFFELGDRKWSVSRDELPSRWPSKMHLAANGWGFLCRHCGSVTVGHGQVPPDVLALFSSRRAFIYFLEIFGQAISLLTNKDRIGKFWVSFCDNRSGLSAIRKGYGRDEAINRFLSWFHALMIRMRWHGHFEWVSSGANLSDKISRGDLSMARARGWDMLSSSLDGIWPIVKRIAVDSEFANGPAVDAMLSFSWAFQQCST